ncbi:hypothetical protein [Streptomyces sp. NPDC047079]|uniref:hypothetical protein n=1 Tax=Streptomyces sp. NPDC047079 TaxID=3154607 RepID=UPI0033C0FB84
MTDHHRAELVFDARRMAHRPRRPGTRLHHTQRPVELAKYTSAEFQARAIQPMRQHGRPLLDTIP